MTRWKDDEKKYKQEWYQKNKLRILAKRKLNYIKNTLKFKNKNKINYQRNKIKINERVKQYILLNPWMKTLRYIQQRCENVDHDSYSYYGGKGIRCLITAEELKFLWFRDKAYEMLRPSIDRLENNKDYTLENCQYLELLQNCRKQRRK